jgi:hypothetical protein
LGVVVAKERLTADLTNLWSLIRIRAETVKNGIGL